MWWCSVRTAGQMAEDVLSCELVCFCTLVLRVDLVYHFIYFCKWDRFIISLFFCFSWNIEHLICYYCIQKCEIHSILVWFSPKKRKFRKC